MTYVTSIDAPTGAPDCTAIKHLCLNTGSRLTREQAHERVKAGDKIRSGSESGPLLRAAKRGTTRYVRTAPNDTPKDNLLQLPRGC